MKNNNYTADEVMEALIKIPLEEKSLLTKSLSVDNLANIENSTELFEEWITLSKNQVRWWRSLELGLLNLDRELKNNREMKEDELFLGISHELFDKMVSVVSKITKEEYELIEKRLYNILEHLSKINTCKGDAMMLEVNGIEIKRNVFEMLEAIAKNWGSYTKLEKQSIGKAVDNVAFVENIKTFNDLMENWDNV